MLIYQKNDHIPEGFVSASEKTISVSSMTHGHKFFELEFILDGEGDYIINGVAYPIRKNAVFLMSPAHVHKVQTKNTRLINVMFQGVFPRSAVLPVWDTSQQPVFHLGEAEGAFLCEMLREIVGTHRQNADYAADVLRCVLQKLALCRGAALQPPPAWDAVLYLLENFRSDLTLSKTAAHFGLSCAYFSDLFHRQTGTTFKEHLDSLRFSYVCSLLAFTDLPIRKVCDGAGFRDYANFTRRFKQRFSCSPREWRIRALIHQ